MAAASSAFGQHSSRAFSSPQPSRSVEVESNMVGYGAPSERITAELMTVTS
jgi:hypothetical protein